MQLAIAEFELEAVREALEVKLLRSDCRCLRYIAWHPWLELPRTQLYTSKDKRAVVILDRTLRRIPRRHHHKLGHIDVRASDTDLHGRRNRMHINGGARWTEGHRQHIVVASIQRPVKNRDRVAPWGVITKICNSQVVRGPLIRSIMQSVVCYANSGSGCPSRFKNSNPKVHSFNKWEGQERRLAASNIDFLIARSQDRSASDIGLNGP